ncbi:hypothetical protein [Sphingopyxis lindanitolerans]|nr:hypothetical protein [Sphingopyxis lindanitolerans]
MTGEKRNPPFGLDIPFDEALLRFARVDPKDLNPAAPARFQQIERMPPSVHTWQKNLSATDAQQETSGGLVPYLRLTSGSLAVGDFQTWFRNEMFGAVAWQAGQFGKKPVEEAYVPFTVIVQGLNIGTIAFRVTHDDTRQNSNNAPNTWLHWPSQMESILHNNDFSGRPVVLTRDDTGLFTLEIQ